MVQNFSQRFTDSCEMQTDTLEGLVQHMDVHIIGHGLRRSRETLLEDYMFPDFLLFYFYQGTALLTHNGQTTRLAPGSFFMYKPFDVYTGKLTCEPPFVFSYVYFNIYPFSARIDFERNAFQTGDDIFDKEWYRQAGALLEEFCGIGGGSIGRKTVLEQSVKNIAARMLYDRLNSHPGEQGCFIGVRQAALLDQTFDYADRHLSEPISIDKIVGSLGISRTTLDRVFRDTLHITPVRALTRFKAERALLLMKQGCSVKEMSTALGYSSSFHFSNAFLSVMGKRPSQYMSFMDQKQIERI